MTGASRWLSAAGLRRATWILAGVVAILLVAFATAMSFPHMIGVDAKYRIKLALVSSAVTYFVLRAVISRRDKPVFALWVFLGLTMLFHFVKLVARHS